MAKDIKLIGGARDLSFQDQVTNYLEIHGCPNRKQKENIYVVVSVEKQQKKRKTQRKQESNEETGSSLRELKTGRLVLTG